MVLFGQKEGWVMRCTKVNHFWKVQTLPARRQAGAIFVRGDHLLPFALPAMIRFTFETQYLPSKTVICFSFMGFIPVF